MKNENSTQKYVIWLSVVAIGLSLITLIAGVFFWLKIDRQEPVRKPAMDLTIRTTENVREQLTMADNSKVWLNSNSILKYAPNYREERRAELNGQAYFKIKEQEPLFTLTTDGINLFTHGASFLINSYQEKDVDRIALYSGELRVELVKLSQVVIMHAGTELIVNRKTGDVEINRVGVGIKGPEWVVYKFEYMIFENILYSISQYYDVSVTNHRPDLNNEPFTLTYDGNMTLDEVMQIMKAVSNKFTYRIDGSELIIN